MLLRGEPGPRAGSRCSFVEVARLRCEHSVKAQHAQSVRRFYADGSVARGSATSRTRRKSVAAFTGFVTKRTPRGR